jgi:hypothetical protein
MMVIGIVDFGNFEICGATSGEEDQVVRSELVPGFVVD